MLRSHQTIVSCSKGVCCLVRAILSHRGQAPPPLGAPHSPPGRWCRGISDTSSPRAAAEVLPPGCLFAFLPSVLLIQCNTTPGGGAGRGAGRMHRASRCSQYSRTSFKAAPSPFRRANLQTPTLGTGKKVRVSVGRTEKLQHLFSEPARRGRQ